MRGLLLIGSLVMLVGLGHCFAADPVPPEAVAYPDHSNLLIVRDTQGNERPVQSKEDWSVRLGHIRANMQLVMGALARRQPSRVARGPIRS